MRVPRMLVSMLTATVLVLGMLAAGLHYFYKPQHAPLNGVRSFEIEYLTPDEAAALLGGAAADTEDEPPP